MYGIKPDTESSERGKPETPTTTTFEEFSYRYWLLSEWKPWWLTTQLACHRPDGSKIYKIQNQLWCTRCAILLLKLCQLENENEVNLACAMKSMNSTLRILHNLLYRGATCQIVRDYVIRFDKRSLSICDDIHLFISAPNFITSSSHFCHFYQLYWISWYLVLSE